MERKTKHGLLVVIFTTLTLITIAGGILYISALHTATTHDDGFTVVSENVAQTPSGNTVTHLIVETPDGSRYQCLTTNGPGGMTCDWGNPLNADTTQSR